MAKIQFRLEAENIGPHEHLLFDQEICSLKSAVFAVNGSGKSFISKVFRLVSNDKFDTIDTNNYLTINKDSGKLSLKITNGNFEDSFEIKLERNTPPKLVKTSTYLYHVFNRKIKSDSHFYKYSHISKGYYISRKICFFLDFETTPFSLLDSK